MLLFRMNRFAFSKLTCVLGGLILNAFVGQHVLAEDTLEIGSSAPALDIQHWVQNGDGKYSKVTSFQKDKVYVVEFWATWCGPCVQSMPHLAALQMKYADKGLQIVSISNEPLEEVEAFLDKSIQDLDGKEVSVEDVTRSYCLTTDPDGSCDKDYMLAAKRDGIPCAFLVGKDSKIEWIGHPMEMEPVIDAILEGKWDREEYIAEQKLIAEVQATIGGLARSKKYAEATKAIDGFLERVTDKRLQFGLLKSKIDLQILAKTDESELLESYKTLFACCESEPLFVQDVAWTAFEKFSEQKFKNKQILEVSISAVEKVIPAVEGGDKANLFDTVARLNHAIGKKEAA
ncbi:MAG: redoxin family protein, partial [Pirellula sp.]